MYDFKALVVPMADQSAAMGEAPAIHVPCADTAVDRSSLPKAEPK
jgi:hypothetical protein